MYNRIFSVGLFCLVIVLFSCKKDNSQASPNPASCNNVSSFTVSQQDDALKFTLNSTGSSLLYEFYYKEQSSGATSAPFTIPPNNLYYLKDLGITSSATYLVYVRSVCSAGNGDWVGPVTITTSAYCERPYSINFVDAFNTGLDWTSDYSPSQCQVQYGVHGFALGSGTMRTIPNPPFNEAVMNANTTYDFYVRLGCGAGWSSWVGPYNYLSTSPHNLCTLPSNVTYTVEFSGGTPAGANFRWLFNGESTSEFTYVLSGANPNSGTTVSWNASTASTPTIICSRNTNYDFYVRNVCLNGNRTAWVGPTVFNIH